MGARAFDRGDLKNQTVSDISDYNIDFASGEIGQIQSIISAKKGHKGHNGRFV